MLSAERRDEFAPEEEEEKLGGALETAEVWVWAFTGFPHEEQKVESGSNWLPQ
jgi:hypothetical protein